MVLGVSHYLLGSQPSFQLLYKHLKGKNSYNRQYIEYLLSILMGMVLWLVY